jgi:hypothetical protein
MSTLNNIKKTILVFGVGKLGGPLVDALATRYPLHRFVLVSRSKEKSQKRANLARYLALQWGNNSEVVAEETDLLNIDRTAELIAHYKPDIVFNATTPFPWWKIDDLPEKERVLAHNAGPGVWCALDCLLPLHLTEALALSSSNAVHINACYPDMTNAFLSSKKNAPRIGIGNISNLVPGLQIAFANELSVSPELVEVKIVGHHFVSWNAPTPQGCPEAPYDLTVYYPTGELHFSGSDTPFAILRKWASRTRGLEGLGVTIGSAATVVSTLLGNSQYRHHSPGALGLPGGYPVLIDFDGNITLNLPKNLTSQKARAVNEAAQIFDGIAYVEAGKVQATSQAQEVHKRILRIDLPLVTYSNVIELALDSLDHLHKRFNLNLNIL